MFPQSKLQLNGKSHIIKNSKTNLQDQTGHKFFPFHSFHWSPLHKTSIKLKATSKNI